MKAAAARRIFSLAKGAVPLAVPGETRAETSMTDVNSTNTAETPVKRKRKVGVSADLASRNWTAFSLMPDGSTKYGEISGNLSDFPAETVVQLSLHGLSQRLTDEARNGETPADRLELLQARINMLREGKWSERVADGRGERVLQAIIAYKKSTGEAFSEEQIAAFRERLKDRKLQDQVLTSKPEVAKHYQELYGVEEAADDDFLAELA